MRIIGELSQYRVTGYPKATNLFAKNGFELWLAVIQFSFNNNAKLKTSKQKKEHSMTCHENYGKMKVSVIIPTYNRKLELISALKSVFNQTEIERIGEVIIVDDGSTDGTVQHLTDFLSTNIIQQPDVILYRQENQGVSRARNEGLKLAKCSLVAFLDSDDVWLPGKIEAQLRAFDCNNEIDFLGCNVIGEELRVPFSRISHLHRVVPLQMQIKNFPVTPSVVMKKRIFDEMGGFDEKLKSHEDCDYWQRICFSGYGVFHLQDGLVKLSEKMRYGESGLSANLKSVHADVVSTLQKHYKLRYFGILRFVLLRALYEVKHYRRTIIVKLKKPT